ncbi:MAG TPA: ABC transporter substrate-binding protein [Eubacteriaceae bacterium]|nr:ABC transporter substrate-binding protein [Eubacteriaceae bacterium]
MKKKWLAVLFVGLMLLGQGCSNEAEEKRIRIAEQYGIAYAPLQIMRHQEMLEKKDPELTVQWEQMNNTTAIREAMVANQLDVGFMAIPPFLIGLDNGMDWKIFSGLSSVPVGLVAEDAIGSLEDFDDSKRIALPQPGSVQHLLLSMACEEEFGDPKRLDHLLVTMAHPDGLNALLSGGDINAHFTSTPYLQEELSQPGYHQILSGTEIFGAPFSFIVGATTASFYEESPEIHQILVETLQEAIVFIEENPQEAAGILTEYYDYSEEEIFEYLTHEETEFSSVVKGMDKFSTFMFDNEFLDGNYKEPTELYWDDVEYDDQDES